MCFEVVVIIHGESKDKNNNSDKDAKRENKFIIACEMRNWKFGKTKFRKDCKRKQS